MKVPTIKIRALKVIEITRQEPSKIYDKNKCINNRKKKSNNYMNRIQYNSLILKINENYPRYTNTGK